MGLEGTEDKFRNALLINNCKKGSSILVWFKYCKTSPEFTAILALFIGDLQLRLHRKEANQAVGVKQYTYFHKVVFKLGKSYIYLDSAICSAYFRYRALYDSPIGHFK